jgi:hypothetical protein
VGLLAEAALDPRRRLLDGVPARFVLLQDLLARKIDVAKVALVPRVHDLLKK